VPSPGKCATHPVFALFYVHCIKADVNVKL